MSACRSCGAVMREGARFCGACGRAAEMQGGCTRCGAPMSAAARFCGSCGFPRPGTVSPEAPGSAIYGEDVLFVVSAAIPREALEAIPAMSILRLGSGEGAAKVQAHLQEHRGIRAVCLVGDAQSVPFARFDDPFGYDEALWSDVPYGLREVPDDAARLAGDVLPDVPVSRIPTHDPALISRLLAPATPHRSWRGGLAVSAAVWSEATSEVVRALGADVPLHLSPPSERDHVETALDARPGRLLFNVHGTDQDAVWLGEGGGRYPEVLRPAGICVGRDAVVVSEACYGATLRDGAGSIAPSFLAEGAACFVGSTVIAWGSGPGGPPMFADELAREVYRGFDDGLAAGDALHRARTTLLSSALDADGGLPAPMHNTLLTFVAYGAPSVKPPAILQGVPTTNLAETREAVRRRLSPGLWQVVSSGRVAFGAFSREFLHGDTVARRLEAMLGMRPADLQVIRYRTRSGDRASVVGKGARHYAGVEVGADGRVLRSFASR